MAKGTKVLNKALKVNDWNELFIKVSDEPPMDGDVAHLEVVLWLDGGDGNKLKVKSRIGASVYNYELAPV